MNVDISILKFKLIAIFRVANDVYNFEIKDVYSRNLLRSLSKRLLRLTNGVFFETAVLVLIGVEVGAIKVFSASESESPKFCRLEVFLEAEAISFNLSC